MKRFLMLLCMTVLLVVVLAVPAFAAEGHTHCLCNDSEELGHTDHQCSSVPFVAVDQDGFEALFADGKLTGNASVYLTEDITLGSEYKLNGNTLNLCLHNKTITMTSTAKLYADGTTGDGDSDPF